MVRALLAVSASVLAAVLAAHPGRASLYQPDLTMTVPVKADGTGEPLPFDEFKRRIVVLTNVASPTVKDQNGRNPDREVVLARVKERQRSKNPTGNEAAALAADLLRLGNIDKALDLLFPLTRARMPNYFVLTTTAQVQTARGEWAEALRYHEAALLDAELPDEVKGWSKEQRGWIASLDRDYVPHYYLIHKRAAEAKPRPVPETEEPTPLFPLPAKDKPGEPVRFVNDAGQYEPGALAAAERAKLPPDAVAIVQQLLLWFPGDTRLYWLLAELYAADGKLDDAIKIMDECAWSRQYGNRKELMDHRAAVAAAVEAKRKADEKAKIDAMPIKLRTVLIYFGVVAGVGVLAAVRALTRRKGRQASGDRRPVPGEPRP